MDIQRIKKMFFLLSGEKDLSDNPQRALLCDELCKEARITVNSMIRGDLTEGMIEIYQTLLEDLAAAKAFYNLSLIDEALFPEITVSGEIKTETTSKSKKAKEFLAEKEKAAMPLLKEKSFFFEVT